jgi:predicted RNA binding protein YcfA (HicA-like mRNA interferase family)
MSRLAPISRPKFVKKLKAFGFKGPFSGGRHMFMSRGDIDVVIPNPHKKDISVDLLARILQQAGISRKDWLR